MELTATPQPADPAAIRAGAGQPPGGASRWRRLGPDLALALILGVAAFLVRRGGLPTHGLWLDDATLSAGINAPLSQIFTVSVDHPGFTAFLGGWSWLTGGSDASLAYPALIAGTLSAPALFLLLRRADYARSISVLLGAALVAAEADIVYSGRVKTYAIDLLVVLLLAFILPKLVRTWWRWPVGVAWVIGSVALATVSGFALFAVALAGVIIVLHPDYDSEVRIPAVVVQEAAVIGLFVIEGNTYNRGPIEETWRQTWDGFISFHGNPLTFAGDVLDHLKQLTEAYPGGPAWLAMTLILIALAGLAVGAWKGRERIRARYLLLILLAAFAGGVAGKFPFGPIVANPISSGHRVSLWLIPVIAMGLAIALRVLRGAIADRGRRLVVGFDVVAYLGAAAILVVALAGDTQAYPYPGAEPATSFIESTATSDDAVLLPWPALYSFAAETDLGTGVTKAPTSAFGYDPTFSDPSIHPFGTTLSPFDVKQAVDGAKRVFVYRPDSFNSIENESAST